jgi:glycosyltransferase involved in cell wall biosynthesis
MASGLPVVATPNPGSRYVTEDGRAGLLVPDDRLGPQLGGLLLDDARRDALADAGSRRSVAFTLDSVTTAYESLYRDAIAARAGGRR